MRAFSLSKTLTLLQILTAFSLSIFLTSCGSNAVPTSVNSSTTGNYSQKFATTPISTPTPSWPYFLVGTKDGGANWLPQNVPISVTEHTFITQIGFTAINCPTATICYLTDINGSLYRTSNTGQTWEKVTDLIVNGSGFSSIIGTHINCPTATICFIGDSHNNLIRFEDSNGKILLEAVTTPNVKTLPVNSSCPTNTTCFAITAGGKNVIKTTDGGKTWLNLKKNDKGYQAVTCFTASDCVLTGSQLGIEITKDSGNTWTNSTFKSGDVGNRILAPVSCGSIEICYVYSANGIFKTTDAGSNWVKQSDADFSNANAYGTTMIVNHGYFFYCANIQECYAGANYEYSTLQPVIATLSPEQWTIQASIMQGGSSYADITPSIQSFPTAKPRH